MFAKTYLAAIVLAIGAAVGWKYYASGELAASLKPAAPPPAIKFDNDYSPTAAGSATAHEGAPVIRKASSGVHKCVINGSVSYTDAPCPHAGAEKNMGGGSVTVVKGQRPGLADAASKAGSVPNVREMLIGDGPKPGEQSMMDKQIERTIGR